MDTFVVPAVDDYIPVSHCDSKYRGLNCLFCCFLFFGRKRVDDRSCAAGTAADYDVAANAGV